jgi:hypothetical protein
VVSMWLLITAILQALTWDERVREGYVNRHQRAIRFRKKKQPGKKKKEQTRELSRHGISHKSYWLIDLVVYWIGYRQDVVPERQ